MYLQELTSQIDKHIDKCIPVLSHMMLTSMSASDMMLISASDMVGPSCSHPA